MKKIARNYRINAQIVKRLETVSAKSKISQTDLIEEALEMHLGSVLKERAKGVLSAMDWLETEISLDQGGGAAGEQGDSSTGERPHVPKSPPKLPVGVPTGAKALRKLAASKLDKVLPPPPNQVPK